MSLNLENWQEKKYQTRGGVQIRILCIDAPGFMPVKGVNGDGDIYEWDMGGGNPGFSYCDLINAPPEPVTITRWANLYDFDGNYDANWHDTELRARELARYDCVAAAVPVSITFTPNGANHES